jgi:hypothetical protein
MTYPTMHPEDLKAVWVCHKCGEVFIFHSDVEDHGSIAGHERVVKMVDTLFSAA